MIGDRQLAKLVKVFIEAPSSKYTQEDIAITFGEARIKYEPEFDDFDATGYVDRAVYGKLMLDAATLAAGTLIEESYVENESFNLYAMKAKRSGKLIAVARLVHAQKNRYTVEVRLLDEEGHAVASGHGTFAVSKHEFQEPHPDMLDEELASEGVAYGSLWRTPFGYIHQN